MNNLNIVHKKEYTTKNSIFAKNLSIPLIIFFYLEDTEENLEFSLLFDIPSFKSKKLAINKLTTEELTLWDINYEVSDPKNIIILYANDNFIIVRENIKIYDLYFKGIKDPLVMNSSKAQIIVDISAKNQILTQNSIEIVLKLSEIPNTILKNLFKTSVKYSITYHLYKKELEFRKKNNLFIKEFKKII